MGEHRGRLPGSRNPNWKGGRSVASNGYVLIKVGKDHHLADVRGYAYEHRLVAEAKLGRRLAEGEIPHHIDGNKQNNHPDNIEVVASAAEHRRHHREVERGLRNPGEDNPEIVCACGCAGKLTKFDGEGRPRRFITGHNPQPSPTMSGIRTVLSDGQAHHRDAIAEACGLTVQAVAVALWKMRKAGTAEPAGAGRWRAI